MIATHRKMEALCVGIPAAFDFSDTPPIDIRRIAILLVAGDDTALTADTFRHVEMKAVLLAESEGTPRNAGRGGIEGCRTVRASLGSCRVLRREEERRALLFRPL